LTLVIGYGNTLCGDDGVGVYIAETLTEEGVPPSVTVITAHQLYPEMSELVSAAERVIFVDARADTTPGAVGQIIEERLEPAPADGALVHHMQPGQLLQLAEMLYGACPPAELVTITGQNFDLGDDFSPLVQAKLPALLALVKAKLV
jgi:hydrogenase maturation protease